MDASIVAAWWGAIVASVVLLWDIFKWFTKGAKVLVTATPNMHIVNHMEGGLEDDRLIFVEAINTGDMPTTITHLIFFQYESLFKKIINKPKKQGAILRQGTAYELPQLLKPGERWTGNIDQSDVLEKVGNKGLLYCGVKHSLRKNPVLVRVKISNENT